GQRYKWDETAQTENARAILLDFFKQAQKTEGAIVVPVAPPAIPGIGTTGGCEFWIHDTGDGDPDKLDEGMQDFLTNARRRLDLLDHRSGPALALHRLSGGEDQRQLRVGLQLRRCDHGDVRRGARSASIRLYVCVVGTRVRGKEFGRHVVDRVRVRSHDRVPRARGAVRIVDAPRRGDDRSAVRHSWRALDELDARTVERRLFPDR